MQRALRRRCIAPLWMIAPFALIACGTTDQISPDGGQKGSGSDGGVAPKTDGGSVPHPGNPDATVPHFGDGGQTGSGDAGYVNPGCGTVISGKIYDPAGRNPLYGVVVYATSTSPLPALPSGASCASCDSLYQGVAIESSAVTDATGSFKLINPPSGNVTVVAQVGKWRRKFSLSVNACVDNPQADGSLTLPKNGSEGDIPQIAVSTGAADTLECMLQRVGLDQAEYTGGAGGTGHIHIFQGGGAVSSPGPQFSGSTAKSETNLWDSQNDMMPYDVVLLSCEGSDTTRTTAQLQALEQYTAAGGRVFMSHFHYDWLNGGTFGNLATWGGGIGLPSLSGASQGDVVTTLQNGQPFIKGQALHDWLNGVGALPGGKLPIYQARFDAVVGQANTSSQPWINIASAGFPPVIPATTFATYFSFDTPVAGVGKDDAGNTMYCGRAVFSDLHVAGTSGSCTPVAGGNCPDYCMSGSSCSGSSPTGFVVPSGCTAGPLSPQEKALEFMLFDLSSCVVPDTVPPPPPPPPPQ